MVNVEFLAEDKIEKIIAGHTVVICIGIILTMIFLTAFAYYAGKESIKHDKFKQKIQEEINW